VGTYVANYTEIEPRVGGRAISATVKPTQAQVNQWILEAEAELLGTLAAADIPTSYSSGARGFLILQAWIGNYVAGLFRQAYAAAAGDGGNSDGRQLIEAWASLLKDITLNPDRFGAMLDAGGSAPSGTVLAGDHRSDAALGLTDTSIAPTFTLKGTYY